jgi:16S rRNA (cytidine1402-2'-O)-methyltransferase
LWESLADRTWPVVAFESPQRLPATLRSLADSEPARPVAVCRELTKRFEEIARGTAAQLAERFPEPPKGEITLVIGAGEGRVVDDAAALAAVAELVDAGVSRRQAAELVGRLTGAARNALYRGSL